MNGQTSQTWYVRHKLSGKEPALTILYTCMYCTGGTECLGHAPDSHSICSIKSRLQMVQLWFDILSRGDCNNPQILLLGFLFRNNTWLVLYSTTLYITQPTYNVYVPLSCEDHVMLTWSVRLTPSLRTPADNRIWQNTTSHSQAFPHLDLHYTVFATDRQRKSENEVDFIVYMIWWSTNCVDVKTSSA